MPHRVMLLLVLLGLPAALPDPALAAGVRGVVAPTLLEAAAALRRGEDPAALRGRPATLAREAARRGALPGRAHRPYVRPDGRLQIQVRAADGADLSALAARVRGLGGTVERIRSAEGLVQARLPSDALDRLGGDPGVVSVRPPRYAYPLAGTVLTEGAGSPSGACLPGASQTCAGGVRALGARTAYGAGGYSARLGRPIRVGIVSDGVAGLGRSVASGDLPASVTVRSFVDRPGDEVRDSSCFPMAEGRALLELIHDLVPDAELVFAAVETDLDYLDAVDWLAGQVDVMVDDIAFFNAGPYDGSSEVAQVRTRAVDAGVVYVGAVGNSGTLHHESAFSPATSTGGVSPIAHRFPNGGLRMPVDVEPRSQAIVFLQWDGTPFDRASTDFDLRAFRTQAGDTVEDASDAPQTGVLGHTPTESVFLDNSGSSSRRTFWVQVDYCGPFVAGQCTAATPPAGAVLTLFVVGGVAELRTADLVRAGSIPNGPDAARIVTVGAVEVLGGDLEDFSSRGRPSTSGLDVKPTVVGPDGVFTTVDNADGLGGGGRAFFGTSAAAPHVAAVAAMLLALDPQLRPGGAYDRSAPAATGSAIRAALADTARAVGSAPVPNPDSGHGAVDAVAAIEDRFAGGPALVEPTFRLTPLAMTGPSTAGPTERVAMARFALANAGPAVIDVHAITASVRLGDTPLTTGDAATTGHERADLRQACIVDEPTGASLGCGRFGADDGRLLVRLGPLAVAPGQTQGLLLVYDLDVQRVGTTVVARLSGPLTFAAALVVVARRPRRARRLTLALVTLVALGCGGGGSDGSAAATCPAPQAADARTAALDLAGTTAAFRLLPMEAGDVVALRAPDGRPVAPARDPAVAPRTVTVTRP